MSETKALIKMIAYGLLSAVLYGLPYFVPSTEAIWPFHGMALVVSWSSGAFFTMWVTERFVFGKLPE